MEILRTTLLNKKTPPSAHISQLSNVSARTRVLGDKTSNVIGYSGMGPPFAYSSVGVNEERLKVVFAFPSSRGD